VAALLDDPTRRSAMGEAARRFGRPDAAASIVDDLCDWLGCPEDLGPEVTGRASSGAGASTDDDDASTHRASLRGHRPYLPLLGARTQPRRSAMPAYRRPVLVYE